MSRRRHPLDYAFNRKLHNYAPETPIHVWESVAHTRKSQLRRPTTISRRTFQMAALLLAFGVGAMVGRYYTASPPIYALQSFPIAVAAPSNAVAPEVIAAPEPNAVTPTSFSNSKSLPSDNQIVVQESPIQLVSDVQRTVTQESSESFDKMAIKSIGHPSLIQTTTLQMALLPRAIPELLRYQSYMPLGQEARCASFGGSKPRFYFDIMASPDMPFRRLAARGSDYETYTQTRQDTEAPRYTYSTALRVSAVMNNGLALRAGVNYSEMRERFEHVIENEVRTIITNRYGANGEIIGTDTLIETSPRLVGTNNTYRTIDIPVMLGYELPLKNITLTFNGGAYFNLLFEQTGNFISPESSQPVNFSSDNPEAYPAFRERLGIGWYGSLGMQYRVGPRLQLLLEPHVRAYPRSFTRQDFMVEQRYLTAGVFVGVRHQFAL